MSESERRSLPTFKNSIDGCKALLGFKLINGRLVEEAHHQNIRDIALKACYQPRRIFESGARITSKLSEIKYLKKIEKLCLEP